MRTFQEISDNYRFTDPEAETLKGLLPIVEPHVETIVPDFYNLFLAHARCRQVPAGCGQAGLAGGEHQDWLLALLRGRMMNVISSGCNASGRPTSTSVFRPTSFTWA